MLLLLGSELLFYASVGMRRKEMQELLTVVTEMAKILKNIITLKYQKVYCITGR